MRLEKEQLVKSLCEQLLHFSVSKNDVIATNLELDSLMLLKKLLNLISSCLLTFLIDVETEISMQHVYKQFQCE